MHRLSAHVAEHACFIHTLQVRCQVLQSQVVKPALSESQDRAVRAQERRQRVQAERLMAAYKG